MTTTRISEAELIEIENRLSAMTLAVSFIEQQREELGWWKRAKAREYYHTAWSLSELQKDMRRLIALVRES